MFFFEVSAITLTLTPGSQPFVMSHRAAILHWYLVVRDKKTALLALLHISGDKGTFFVKFFLFISENDHEKLFQGKSRDEK